MDSAWAILGGIALFIVEVISVIGYNKFRRNIDGKTGVGSAIFCTIGLACLIGAICALIGGSEGIIVSQLIIGLIFGAAMTGYLVYMMITRCSTGKERVGFLFSLVFTAWGFLARFILNLVLGFSMYRGEYESVREQVSKQIAETGVCPSEVFDKSGNRWKIKEQYADSRAVFENEDGGTYEYIRR